MPVKTRQYFQEETVQDKLLRDPLLWLRIEHTEQQVNEVFGNTFKSTTPLEITTEDYLALRYRLCDEVLKEASGFRDYLAKAGEKDAGLLSALFPHRPGAVQVLVPAGEVRVEGQQAVSCAESVGQKGVVTDLCSPEAVHFKAPHLRLYPVPLTAREDTHTVWGILIPSGGYSYFPGSALNREDITVYAGTVRQGRAAS